MYKCTFQTTLEVFAEMERMDLLSDTNLNKLETIIQSVCPVLKEMINQFKALQGELPKIYTDSEANTGDKMFTFKIQQGGRKAG